jgi:hypothetical protein
MYTPSMMRQILEIRKIDPAAADFLMGNKIRSLIASGELTVDLTAGDLLSLFVWEYSPQGDIYWRDLHCMTSRAAMEER